jgi:hypothetical protein
VISLRVEFELPMLEARVRVTDHALVLFLRLRIVFFASRLLLALSLAWRGNCGEAETEGRES